MSIKCLGNSLFFVGSVSWIMSSFKKNSRLVFSTKLYSIGGWNLSAWPGSPPKKFGKKLKDSKIDYGDCRLLFKQYKLRSNAHFSRFWQTNCTHEQFFVFLIGIESLLKLHLKVISHFFKKLSTLKIKWCKKKMVKPHMDTGG